jgi:hypothetical protein
MSDEQQLDDLEGQIYELKLYMAAVFRTLVAKKIATAEELRKLAAEIDAEDGAVDREYFGEVLPPDNA